MTAGTLGQRQEEFSHKLGKLLIFAYEKGYKIRMGDVLANEGHKPNSNHYIKLAADLNLFKDGFYLAATEDHIELGEYWESIGGSWGGRFGDGNHYSLEWKGRK